MDTLVKYRHIVVSPPTNETETLLLESMCLNASMSMMLKCGREYGFADKNEPARATAVNSNNIPSERIFSVFDRKAVTAKSSNHKFKAKSIRNDMTIYQSSVSNIPDQKVSAILKILNAREKEWDSKQRELHENKIIEKLKKANNQSIYTRKLLQQCKTWGGPAASMEELNEILQKHSEIDEKVVRTEVSYYRVTHKTEISYQLHLFKVNRITHEERLINFCVLLGQNGQKVQEMNLPSNEEALTILREKDNPIEIQHTEIEVNQIYVTICIEKKPKNT